jgi:hypothetical protein
MIMACMRELPGNPDIQTPLLYYTGGSIYAGGLARYVDDTIRQDSLKSTEVEDIDDDNST